MPSKKEPPADNGGQLPSHFVFTTNSLYARAGFERGNLMGTAFPHLGAAELRDLLVDVLQTHVIPRLDQNVQTLIVPTVHNPLRAVNVDGVSVRWNAEMGNGPPLTPATIRVSLEDVLACARRRKIPAVPTAA